MLSLPRFRLALLSLLLAGTTGCGPDQMVSAEGIVLEPEQESVARPAPVTLRLSNLSARELVFHPCEHLLQHRPGKEWLSYPPGPRAVCQLDAPRRLLPGEAKLFQLAIPDEAPAGRYRVVLDIQLGGEPDLVVSSEFTLGSATSQ